MTKRSPMAWLLVLLVTLGAVGSLRAQEATPEPPRTLRGVDVNSLSATDVLVPEVLSVREHSTTAYTQGLILHAGLLYESTGQRGASTLREVDPASGAVLRQVNLPDQLFAEGLALVGDRLIQLTWTSGIARYYDRETFVLLAEERYGGQGWGLCYDAEVLWMTDGSSTLFIRDARTFDLLETRPVTLEGTPIDRLNELECVGEHLYANVYQSDYIVRIEKSTGEIDQVIDAISLWEQELSAAERADLEPRDEVLNGIAWDPENEVFYLTGKHWPKLFEVRFVAP
ncbi:MAG: glutaminyl-peptide cyclotransferase [Anaerolineae bacterium]|nr:glutaminyl-peptide cyclotransferase [Anaerolineae bacterium]